MKSGLQTLRGKIEKIVFQNPENGYTVLQVSPQESDKNRVTVVGHFPQALLAGLAVFDGTWQTHPTHGEQFVAKSMVNEENDVDALSQMLVARQLEGVGARFAAKLLHKFGKELPSILDTRPERIKEVPGIGKQRYDKLMKSWKKYKASYDAMLFLLSHQMNMSLAERVWDRYEDKTIQTIKTNPYVLMQDFEGVGFQTADMVARAMGFAHDNPYRVEAALYYCLQQATQYGHCGMARNDLIRETARFVHIQEEEINTILSHAVEEDKFIEDTVGECVCIFPLELYFQEQYIAKKMKQLLSAPLDKHAKALTEALTKSIEKEEMVFSPEQLEAMFGVLTQKVFVITGGPGVGKTTIVRWLVNVFSKQKMEVALAAPTGRAAKRLAEMTGMEAKTIHRLLEYDPYSKRFRYQGYSTLPYDVIILDEASMIDVPLCAAVMEAIPEQARLIIVGDADQLASVGPGDVLRSLIQSDVIPCQRLKTIFRQKEFSRIVENAHRINQGQLPLIETDKEYDFYWVNATDPDSSHQKMLKMISERIPQRFDIAPRDVQVLAPTNEGPLGVNTLNRLLQEAINPPEYSKQEIKHRDRLFREGDKVIQIVNDYEKNIFNGDIGWIKTIEPDDKFITVMFDQQEIEYSAKEWDQLKLAYAITIHKSQGSEYPAVIVMFSMVQKRMLSRNLLYTAVSRGKSCVIMLCEKTALAYGVNTQTVSTRMNKLEEWLNDDSI